MGEHTKIAWADSTWNPWIGCTHAGTGCDHCYAETQNKYRKWNGGTWGNAAPRQVTAKGYWRKPLNWEDQARAGRVGKDAQRWLVFAGDLCDIFDHLGDKDVRMHIPVMWATDSVRCGPESERSDAGWFLPYLGGPHESRKG